MHRVMPLPVLEAVDCPQRRSPPTTAPMEISFPFAVRRDAVSRESFPPGPMRLYPSVGGILTSTSHVKIATMAPHVRVPVVTFLEEEVETSLSPMGDDVSPQGSPRHDKFCSECMSFECRQHG